MSLARRVGKRRSGFTLLEVIVGTTLLLLSAGFMMRALVLYLHAETTAMAKENLTLFDENIARNVLANLITFSLDATANTSNYCNFGTVPIANYLNQTFASNIRLTLVDPNTNVPPDFPDHGGYTQARARCLANQTHKTVAGGNFRNTSSYYFCTTAKGDWQAAGISGSNAALSQTVLTEFSFSIRNETNAAGVPCNLLGTYARGSAPSNGSALIAHLLFAVHTVNRSVSTRQLASNAGGMAYQHTIGALRSNLPNSPDFPAIFGDIALGAENLHNAGRNQPAPSYSNLGAFTDCGSGLCSGSQYFSVLPVTTPPVGGTQVLTDIWVQPSAHAFAGLPGLVPAGYTVFGALADCGDGSSGNMTCNGNMLFAKRVVSWSVIPSGGTYISGLWITPTGTHSTAGLNCPPGWTLKGLNADCGGVTSGNCTGHQNVCVQYATKP